MFPSSQRSCASSTSSFSEKKIQRFRDWKSPNSQTWDHAVEIWNQSLRNEANKISNTNENGKIKYRLFLDPLK